MSLRYILADHSFPMRLENIGDVEVDTDDNLYVCVRGCETPVVEFDSNGRFIRGIGRGMGIVNPHGLHIDREGFLWLIDCSRHVVYKMDHESRVVMTIGVPDQPCWESGVINGDYKTIQRAGGPFNGPTRLDTNSEGELFIADGYNNCCVHHFSKEGKLLHSWGAPGTAPGAFNIVHSIKLDPMNMDVYIADRENRRVQIFTPDGQLKAIWPNLHRPTDISFYEGLVYVSELGEKLFTDVVNYDYHLHDHYSQISIFDRNGTCLGTIGTEDIGAPGSFMAAHCVCVDSKGAVYVGEVNNYDIASLFTAFPEGQGWPRERHPGVQKFEKTE